MEKDIMDAAIQKAQERLDFVANNKESLREYHMREMALSDWTSGVNHARRTGKNRITQGRNVPGYNTTSGRILGPLAV